MVKYHSLQVFKYSNPTENLSDEYNKRIENPATIVTNLKINSELHGNVSNKQYPLFIVPIKDILKLQSIIEQNSREIRGLTDDLPGIASDQFFSKTLTDEIMSTNEIEGVKTLNKEVIEAISSAESKSKKKIRLQSFARMYLKIKNEENLNITSLEDIRSIYDFLLDGEISKDELPDGDLFRNKYARVGTDTYTVHLPKMSEKEISIDLMDWITFINNDDVPPIMRSFIAHYFFENIHPFNDGNGRTGRYIACVYLGYKLDPLSAITFSSEINKNKEKYYKAFKEVSNPNNFGEVTFFTIDMMKIFIKGQKRLIDKMKNNKELLLFMQKSFQNDSKLTEMSKSLLYLFAQAFLFNDSGFGLEDRELKKFTTSYHWTAVKRCLDELTAEKVLTKTNGNPITRRISHEYIDNIANDNG